MITESDVGKALEQFRGRKINGQLKREINDCVVELIADNKPCLNVDVTFDKASGTMAVSVDTCN